MDKFDRELQLELLTKCVNFYPRSPSFSDFNGTSVMRVAHHHPEKLIANIWYLKEHGLISMIPQIRPADDCFRLLSNMIATKDGVDFLLQDGGLSSILNITTIKLHDETMSILAKFIETNAKTPEDKKKFLSQLRELPYETTKHIALELVGKGLAQMPDAIQWLQTALLRS